MRVLLDKINSRCSVKKDIDFYRKTIAPMVNKIKHANNQLRAFVFQEDKVIVLGYFVEGMDDSGAAGPNPDIHEGGDTAFSFNRDLKYHLYHIYKISHHLSIALKEAIHKLYNVILPTNIFLEGNDGMWIELVQRVGSLPHELFPDEKAKPVPEVLFYRDEKDYAMIGALPSSQKPVIVKSGKLNVLYSGDSVTKSFIVPYLKDRTY